jgi:hypothetical protein
MMLQFNTYEPRVFKTYQMYRKKSLQELEWDLRSSERNGIQLGVKLVRGAYLGKQEGILPNKLAVDKSFREGLNMSLGAGNNVHTLVATHMRLKLILHEALDIAHTICEHGDTNAEECMWAWEMVDEIDDAATRAGVKYQ